MALTLKTSLSGLQVGDYVWCKYYAPTSGQLGTFSDLATKTDAEVSTQLIPASSSATPNGYFKFIKVDVDHLGRDILIADRNIQNAISWDTLNTAGVASGSGVPIRISFMPQMTSNTSPSPYVISANGQYGNDAPFKAFDYYDVNDSNRSWWYIHKVPRPEGGHWLKIDLGAGNERAIAGFNMSPMFANNVDANCLVKNFKVFGSNDDVNWTELGSFTHPNGARKLYYSLDNNQVYRYYRFNFLDSYPTATWDLSNGVQELVLYEEYSYNFKIRLLTGGVNSADKDNEWDTYIVNSTLNGTITAGDNAVWNWSGISSWTSTTPTSNAGQRVLRGNTGATTYSTYTTSGSIVSFGFRPVLIVEIISNPPTFEGSVDRPSIHDENVTLTGTISHPDNKDVKYRILVNGVQEYPETGFTVLAPPPISINYTVSNSKFRLGSNQITVEMVTGEGDIGTWATTVTLDSQAPDITATMTGMKLSVQIADSENDKVMFRVLLNGSQVHPVDPTKEFTDLESTPVNYTKLFRSNEVAIGSNNTVTIIAKDRYGALSTITLDFIGEYAGLMFSDEFGNYYSDDLGNVLQYLDIGLLVAGQVSETYPIRLINKTGFAISNIQLWKDRKTLPSGTEVEISLTAAPFEPTDLLVFPQTLDYDDEVTFYVRVVTQLSGQPGQGEFDVYVKGDPS